MTAEDTEPGEASTPPEWLANIAAVARGLTASQLTSFRPPRDARPRSAAVLMLFAEGPAGPEVLLLERSHQLRSHPGQVAFPGGSRESGDADAAATAVREAAEETGLDPSSVEVLAVLPELWLPPSNFVVTPVLGWWRRSGPVYGVDPAETASVHRIPLAELLDPANRASVRHPSGYVGPAFLVRGLFVWGFTAGLLSRLLAAAGWEQPWDAARVVELPGDLVRSSMRDLARGEPD